MSIPSMAGKDARNHAVRKTPAPVFELKIHSLVKSSLAASEINFNWIEHTHTQINVSYKRRILVVFFFSQRGKKLTQKMIKVTIVC